MKQRLVTCFAVVSLTMLLRRICFKHWNFKSVSNNGNRKFL